jgi:hypothetical protein
MRHEKDRRPSRAGAPRSPGKAIAARSRSLQCCFKQKVAFSSLLRKAAPSGGGMLTDSKIEAAKVRIKYTDRPHHEHPDCIRLAYEWLDAHNTITSSTRKYLPLKHIIEKWAGRYISESDINVAAEMHPRIMGTYPNFNLSARLTRPHDRRLEGIGEALTQDYRERINETRHSIVES